MKLTARFQLRTHEEYGTLDSLSTFGIHWLPVERSHPMKAIFLVANNCWAILFGDALIDLDGQRLFNAKRELIDALKSKGLKMQGRTIVSA